MTADSIVWTYSLAPDATVDQVEGTPVLVTPASRTVLDGVPAGAIALLAANGASEDELIDCISADAASPDAGETCASLLFRLDRLGLLARRLSARGRLIAACVPRRHPPGPQPDGPPDGRLRLAVSAVASGEHGALCLEAPGAWARVRLYDRGVVPILHDLAVGRPASEIVQSMGGEPTDAVRAVLALMSWCGLIETAGGAERWALHDRLFHTRTRRGYGRVRLGRRDDEPETPGEIVSPAHAGRRIPLERPDLSALIAGDPPHALVSERRQSVRRQGAKPLTLAQLSEWVFRTLADRSGRRPYPSGGGCYPLRAYLAIHQCFGLAQGLYAYDPVRHELAAAGGPGAGLDDLLRDAAGAAGIGRPPQVLLVLAAEYARMHRRYGDLAYSLILKEAGAVFQTAMLAAAAMDLAACAIGCGDSLRFAELAGVDPLAEVSVAELMLGSRDAGA